MFRIVAFFSIWLCCWLPLAIPIAIAIDWHPPKPLTPTQKLSLLAPLYLIAPLLLWGIAWVEGVPFSIYGLSWNFSTLVSLALGLVLAVMSLAFLFGFQSAAGWLNWQFSFPKTQLLQTLLFTLLLGLWISWTEELIFRGFLFNELSFLDSPWLAAAISSIIFALLHLVWEIQETAPQLLGLWLMGTILVLARWVDNGNLGLAWGLHAGWILGIATIDSTKLITYSGKVPAWITGLAEKPLAGLAGIICLLVTGAVLWLSYNFK